MIRKIVKAPLVLVFFINSLALLLSIVSPYIDPVIFWPPAVFGLFFKLFIGVNVLLGVLFLLLRAWRPLVISAILVFLSWGSITNTLAFPGDEVSPNDSLSTGNDLSAGSQENDPAEGTDTSELGQSSSAERSRSIKIMTWNVKSFDYYSEPGLLDSMLHVIVGEDPDILFMQEYYVNNKQGKGAEQRFQSLFKHMFEFKIAGGYVQEYYRFLGLVILSKRKLFNTATLRFNNSANGACHADIRLGNDTFRLINVHFQSYKLSEGEYVLPDEIDSSELSELKGSLVKFRNAFRKRSVQVKAVKEIITASPYKAILAGDFNDSPVSFVYRNVEDVLDDAFIRGGSGLGSTFAGRIPFQRIDYIFTDPGITPLHTYVVREKLSDHFPVVSVLRL